MTGLRLVKCELESLFAYENFICLFRLSSVDQDCLSTVLFGNKASVINMVNI